MMMGWLVAAIVVLFASAPTLDAAICATEEAGQPAAGSTLAVASMESGHADPAGHVGGSIHCAHGHCHHGSVAASQGDQPITLANAGTAAARPSPSRLPESALLSQDRPPPRA